VTRILITGMSGTSKTFVIEELSRHGFRAIDTHSDKRSEWTRTPKETDWIWHKDKMQHC
jgi:signal recognition particle receptor subunit beta